MLDLDFQFQNLKSVYSSWQVQVENNKKSLADLRHKITLHSKALVVLQKLAEILVVETEKQTASLASLALQDTFPDQNLTLEVNHTIVRGQPAVELLLCDHQRDIQDEPLHSFGGGPSSLLGVVVRIITIIRRKRLLRSLILDEPTAQVSESYQPLASKFLKQISLPRQSGGLGFDCLVITHSPVLAQQAHRRYNAFLDDTGYLQLEEV